MQSLALSKAMDKIDLTTWHSLRSVHASSNNTHLGLSAFSCATTAVTESDVLQMEFAEHTFTGDLANDLGRQHVPDDKRMRSADSFDPNRAVDVDQLSLFLSQSFGETQTTSVPQRPYASGGALYSGQVCFHARNVKGLEPGCYHYLPVSNRLEKLPAARTSDIAPALGFKATENRHTLNDYAFALLYCVVMQVPVAKYGMRGYRLAHLEVGAMYHEMSRSLQRAGLRDRVWGGFEDDRLSIAMGIDPRVAWPMVVQLGGYA